MATFCVVDEKPVSLSPGFDKNRVFDHIRQNGKDKKIHVDFINGYLEHVHCLISLGADQTIEKLMQLIKGESSFWTNRNKLTKTRFE